MANDERLEMAQPVALDESRHKGFWRRLKKGLSMTHTELLERISAAVEGRDVLDPETLEHLEEGLIAADLGVSTTLELMDGLKTRVTRGAGGDVARLRQLLADEVTRLLGEVPTVELGEETPRVTLVVGVNGTGKTTTVAKLARWSQARGEDVLLAAGDTFRAAAIEQLVLWGERLGVDVIRQGSGADPAAVVYDALQAARARRVDHLIVDTAGRLHTKANLMQELAKIHRVIDREAPTSARRTLLVLDATTGHNALSQAREFSRTVAVDGLVLAKIDGTAKGGMAVAVCRELALPVLYLGVGEGAEDLVEFRPREFAEALIG